MYGLHLNDDKIHLTKESDFEDKKKASDDKKKLGKLKKHVLGTPKKRELKSFKSIIESLQTLEIKRRLFCINEGCYLVKKYFTEGVQRVNQGEVHIYYVIGNPLNIYIFNPHQTRVYEEDSFKSKYEKYTTLEIISSRIPKIVPENTYYLILATYHTIFKKTKTDMLSIDLSSIYPSLESGLMMLQANRMEDSRIGSPSTEEANQNRIRRSHEPSRSRDDANRNSRHSMELETFSNPEVGNGSNRRLFPENDTRASTSVTNDSSSEMEVVLVSPSPNSVGNELGLLSNSQEIDHNGVHNHQRAVFGIRKDSSIESYALRSDSTFQILQNNMMTGSFAIENNDMDPDVIEYRCERTSIRELARFKNGSTLENTLTVEQDLLNELRDPERERPKEKVVVDYFFQATFKIIADAYNKFSEMQNMKMIGSCVPAVVLLNNSEFRGSISDSYEARP